MKSGKSGNWLRDFPKPTFKVVTKFLKKIKNLLRKKKKKEKEKREMFFFFFGSQYVFIRIVNCMKYLVQFENVVKSFQ